jgi:hypothetical protein
MPRYYFHLTDGKQVLDDHKGMNLPGNDAARDGAMEVARDRRHGVRRCPIEIGPAGSWRSSTRRATKSTRRRMRMLNA